MGAYKDINFGELCKIIMGEDPRMRKDNVPIQRQKLQEKKQRWQMKINNSDKYVKYAFNINIFEKSE